MAYDENKVGRVLKTDVIGRVKTGARQRERVLDEFERSGLSGMKFAAVAGINYQTFASWVQKRRRAMEAYLRSRVHPQKNSRQHCCPARAGLGGGDRGWTHRVGGAQSRAVRQIAGRSQRGDRQ